MIGKQGSRRELYKREVQEKKPLIGIELIKKVKNDIQWMKVSEKAIKITASKVETAEKWTKSMNERLMKVNKLILTYKNNPLFRFMGYCINQICVSVAYMFGIYEQKFILHLFALKNLTSHKQIINTFK